MTRRVAHWARAHPDLLLGGGVVLLGLGLRLAFLFRAPPLLEWRDSASYALPALALLSGEGFEPEFKRPPLYPLFLAGAFWLLGEDLRAPLVLQHLLGALGVGLTYRLGSGLWGRPAGLGAGAMAALNGDLLFLEHSIMAESLFTFLLLATLLAATRVRGSRPWAWALAAGLLLGLAALTRPGAFMLAPLLAPVLAWLAVGSWRRRVLVGGLFLGACVATVLPWMARNGTVHGTFTIAGGLGEALIYRTRHADRSFVYREPEGGSATTGDNRLAPARRWVYRQLARTDQTDVIWLGLLREFKLSETQADGLLSEIALHAIRQDPARYLTTTAGMEAELLLGRDKRLAGQWETSGKPKFREQWADRATYLLGPATPAQEREFETAQAVLRVYEHEDWGGLLSGLFLVGALGAAILPRARPALPTALAAIAILTLNVAVSGALSRHRVSVEPLLAVVALGGPTLLWDLTRSAARTRPSWRGLSGRVPAPRT